MNTKIKKIKHWNIAQDFFNKVLILNSSLLPYFRVNNGETVEIRILTVAYSTHLLASLYKQMERCSHNQPIFA